MGSNQNGDECFPDISSERHSACSTFAEIYGAKKYSSIFNFIGKGEAFHGLLCNYVGVEQPKCLIWTQTLDK